MGFTRIAAIIGLLLVPGALCAQDTTHVVIRDGTLGFAYCSRSGVAAAFIGLEVVDSGDEDWVKAHERKHLDDMRAKGCAAFKDWIVSPKHGAELEIRAYCASVPVAQRTLGWDPRAAIIDFAMRIVFFYDFGFTFEEVHAAMTKECG